MAVARHPRPPELVDTSIEDIMDQYVARFKDRIPDWEAFEDAKIEGYKRAQHRFIGAGGSGTNTLGNADITAVFFEESTYAAAATGTVVVIYNELVDVTNGATLVVTNTTDSASITATAAAQTDVNRVEFTFTCAAASKVHTIGAQTISGTIVDANTSTASDKVFVLGDTIGAGGSGSTKTITTT